MPHHGNKSDYCLCEEYKNCGQKTVGADNISYPSGSNDLHGNQSVMDLEGVDMISSVVKQLYCI
jgi:hypothetical protein